MSFTWMIYWFSVIDKLGAISGAFAFFGIAVGIILTAIVTIARVTDGIEDDTTALWNKIIKTVFAVGLISLPLYITTPSERTMYLMVAGAATQTVIDNQQTGDVAKEGMDVIKQFLVKEKERLMNDGKK